MPDPELQWIPDQTTPAIPIRTRVIGVVVFAAILLAIGFGIGRLTAGFPAGTQSEAISRPAVEKRAVKSNNPPAQKSTPPLAPQIKEAASPPIGPASAGNRPGREDLSARTRELREQRIESARRDKREPHAADDQRDVLSQPARDYQSLREYMFGR
jgi:type IV secretory pathway VirB10-like protein